MWEVTYTITPHQGYVDWGERLLYQAGVRLQAVHSMEVLCDDSVVVVHEVDGDVEVLRETLDTGDDGKIVDYTITNQSDPIITQIRVQPDETFQRLLDIHRSYGVSVNFPIRYLRHEPVTIEMIEIGPKDQLRSRIEATREIATVQVEQLNRYELVTRQLYKELTDRQREVLLEAVRQGYYRNPRGATHEDIAAELSCSASVVGQHLRRIETTLVTSIVPNADVGKPAPSAQGD